MGGPLAVLFVAGVILWLFIQMCRADDENEPEKLDSYAFFFVVAPLVLPLILMLLFR
jgi:hypothetical protein